MNKKIFFVSFLLLGLFLIVSCASVDVAETEDSMGDEEAVVEVEGSEETVAEEVVVANTESSNVERTSDVTQVVIEGFVFNPMDITVKVGDTIEWINMDDVAHTVTFEDARFDVEVPAGAVVSYTFTEELGEARYFCAYHPLMRGSVLVVE